MSVAMTAPSRSAGASCSVLVVEAEASNEAVIDARPATNALATAAAVRETSPNWLLQAL